MMTFGKFRELYNLKSKQLVGAPANDEAVKQAYDSYQSLVDFIGYDGNLEFEKSENKRELRVILDPHWPPIKHS